MQHVLVTGANRGIGLEFARQFAERGERVFAACRNPDQSPDLQRLTSKHSGRLTIVTMDVTDENSIQSSHALVSKETKVLDLLVNNAGVYSSRGSESPKESLGNLHVDEVLRVMRVNAIGPIFVAQQYLDLLKSSKEPKIVNITSGYGSVSDNTSRFPYYYSASKAALNQLTRSLAHDVRKWNMIALVMDPGWVATDMGGRSAPTSAEESVRNMIQIIDSLTPKESGEFLNRFGEKQNW